MPSPPFHLAFPVTALEPTLRFFVELLGCRVGRQSERWIDFDFFGHQITAHLTEARAVEAGAATNSVDGDEVPLRHFGVVLEWDAWRELADRLERGGIEFVIRPHVRFAGEVGEQATLFIADPSGNHLEFKAFRDPERLFAR